MSSCFFSLEFRALDRKEIPVKKKKKSMKNVTKRFTDSGMFLCQVCLLLSFFFPLNTNDSHGQQWDVRTRERIRNSESQMHTRAKKREAGAGVVQEIARSFCCRFSLLLAFFGNKRTAEHFALLPVHARNQGPGACEEAKYQHRVQNEARKERESGGREEKSETDDRKGCSQFDPYLSFAAAVARVIFLSSHTRTHSFSSACLRQQRLFTRFTDTHAVILSVWAFVSPAADRVV